MGADVTRIEDLDGGDYARDSSLREATSIISTSASTRAT
jgi:crotonobetainyl-CoA:carnitine CoA-transferase CaiB-like acyl-CoA transferase